MIIIKRWIIIALAALVVLATALSIILATCGDGGQTTSEPEVSSNASSSYTESEIEEIKEWWSSVEIEEESGSPIETQ